MDGSEKLGHFGQQLLQMAQRRQAGRVRLGRALDAAWSGGQRPHPRAAQEANHRTGCEQHPSTSVAAPARSGR